MYTGTWWCLLVMAVGCCGEKWQFPGESAAASVRIDNKVKFLDGAHFNTDKKQSESRVHAVQADDVPFREPTDTEGFYNRPPGIGRYPVTVEEHQQRAPYRVNGQAIFPVHNRPKNYESDGTLDSLQFCKCVSTPNCNPHTDSARACGTDKYLCCYKRGNQESVPHSEYFNEIDDERPSLLPGQENFARPFPPPPGAGIPGNQNGGIFNRPQGVLVGPQGPTGNIGNSGVLVGPEGPTGIIGPAQQKPAVLVGPNGPTGVVGPVKNLGLGSEGSKDYIANESAQRGVLVGPGGPTGIIGPAGGFGRQPVLVGPGGPTGIIGPVRTGRQGVLVGPGGPTGIIGPYGRPSGPGVLVGPGGPTGIIGPGRGVLVGPGGPTGRIGPRFFNY